MTANLSGIDLECYQRQIALPQIGLEGQRRLCGSSVLIVGAGALGSILAYYCTGAGIHRIGIMDADCVERSNLQRQIIHNEDDLGEKKVLSAVRKLRQLNPRTVFEPYAEFLTGANAETLLGKYDFILDAADNFEAKFLIGETAWKLGIPHTYAGINAFEGQAMTFLPEKGGPCIRCLFRHQPPQRPPVGPFGAVAGIIASIEAAEAIKYLSGLECSLQGNLLYFDALTMNSRKIPLRPILTCPCCGSEKA